MSDLTSNTAAERTYPAGPAGPGEEPTPRSYDELLAEAIRVLTEAARLRPAVVEPDGRGGWVPGERTEPADWAEFVTLAVTGAAANVGGVERALRGRSGSWEAESVQQMIYSTVGEDPAELARHRTEPLRVTLYPTQYLYDMGYDAVYEASKGVLQSAQHRLQWRYELAADGSWRPVVDEDQSAGVDVPAYTRPVEDGMAPRAILAVPRRLDDEAEIDRLYDLEADVEDLEYEGDPAAYGQALMEAVLAKAAELVPGVEVVVDVARWEPSHAVDAAGAEGETVGDWYGTLEDTLLDAALLTTPLPWSGLSRAEYPLLAHDVVAVEQAAGRLPHHRLTTPRVRRVT